MSPPGGQAVEMCLAGSHFGKSECCHQQCGHPRRGGIVGGRDQQPGIDRLGLGAEEDSSFSPCSDVRLL